MLSSLIDFLANIITSTIDVTGYGGIFFLMLMESCGVPAPSEIIMPFAGFLAAEGKMLLWGAAVAGTLGNLAGSLLAYYIGLKGGRPLLEKWGRWILISKHDLDKADRWFARYGEMAVLIGRLLPVVRTYISFPAGLSKMSVKKFSFYTVLGAFPWCLLFAWLGVKMQNNWEQINEKLHDFNVAVVVLLILLGGLYVWRHWKNRKA
jgi:membrane protein DedA with SNARE-associated domain